MQQDQLKSATDSVNNELEEIRRIRDEIVRTAKDINENLISAKGGRGEGHNALTHLNQNLKQMAETSLKNIDMLTPEKFELVNKIQNFNLEGYTHHLNQLKKQISELQRESENVEKELRQRVTKLEKVNISPQFEAQLLEPYEKNIKLRLATIDLQETKKRVYEKLGEFDYFAYEDDLNSLTAEIKEEMGNFDLICREYRISVPLLKLDQKEMKALDLRLPSILE